MSSDIGARVRAKFPLDEAVAEIWTGKLLCDWCRRECSIIAGVFISIGELRSFFNVAELGAFELQGWIWAVLGEVAREHKLRWRQSAARGHDLFCNGCPECGDILGEHLDIGAGDCREKLGTVPIELDMWWRRAMLEPGDARERARAARM